MHVMNPPLRRSTEAMHTDTCLVLLFKSPRRAKRRLAEEIGGLAQTAAAHLLECAIDDLGGWRGPTCLAPAARADAAFARERGYTAALQIVQQPGNLGERIAALNAALLEGGHERQLFIGSDCPGLDTDYLELAAAALRQADVVLGPAEDGGVVVMGVTGEWPPLADLPWSSARLGAALREACEAAGLRVAILAAHGDVDSAADLSGLPGKLAADRRASRRRLCEWIAAEPTL